jgi:peroxiredoxin Q/BCP
VVNAYGVWGMLGGTVPLTARRSFLIDPDGNIAKLYPDVDPSEHVEEILQDLDNLQND